MIYDDIDTVMTAKSWKTMRRDAVGAKHLHEWIDMMSIYNMICKTSRNRSMMANASLLLGCRRYGGDDHDGAGDDGGD
jgi:hypothetical protein